jgi:hypothetical protein
VTISQNSTYGRLDEAERRVLLALLSSGNSRRAAARFVGCAPYTITRLAMRDPQFAAEVARAEQAAEIHLLRLVQTAAKSEKHWRAAAWLLERRNPQDFGPRAPHVFTGQDVAEVVAHFFAAVTEDLPDELYDRALGKLEELMAEAHEARPGKPAVPPVQESLEETAVSRWQELVRDQPDATSGDLTALNAAD